MTFIFIIHTIIILSVILVLAREFINTPADLKTERRFEREREEAQESIRTQWKTLNKINR